MKSNNLFLLFLTIVTLYACNNSQENKIIEPSTAEETKTENSSASEIYKIDVLKSTTTYIGSKPTGKHNGKVGISKGFFRVENHEITGGKMILDINTISVDDIMDQNMSLGKSVLINHLKSDDFLDVQNYPTGAFEITSLIPITQKIEVEEKKEFESEFKPLSNIDNVIDNPTHIMAGKLTLKGIRKTISFPVKIQYLKFKIKAEAKFNIDRTDWNITYGEEASITDKLKDKFIYNTVNLGFNVEAVLPNIKSANSNLAPKIVDVFESKFGIHHGKRRNHISGFCFSGSFKIKDPNIKKYSKSEIFSTIPLKVVGRFSHKGGVKKDESTPGEYGMAFEISLQDGSTQNFSMNTLDFFPVKSPEGFMQLMKAKLSGNPEDFKKLKIEHPEIKNFKAHYKNKPKVLKAYANHQFNSVNSFYLEDKKGNKTPIRWAFVPKNDKIVIDSSKKVDLFKETSKALQKRKSLSWEMKISIANENDDVANASLEWEGPHQEIIAAELVIDQITREGACNDKNFDPLHLQAGFLPSNDPILKFRSPVYATTFVRRLQEKQHLK